MIRLNNVTKSYPARAEENNGGLIKALDDISLAIAPGEWVAMMGPSGSGKSTMVNLIGCLDRPTSGEIWLDGQNVASLSASELNHVRAETIGFVFQQFHMIPYLSAVENVMLAQYFHSMTDEKEALEALDRVGLKDRAGHLPSQLSGGEQQRVCIARALINDPKIVLADEPTGNLDAINEEIVLRLLRELHQQGRTIVMVTHDPVVARLADRRVELHHGKIAAQEVFSMADDEQFDEVANSPKSVGWKFTALCRCRSPWRKWPLWVWLSRTLTRRSRTFTSRSSIPVTTPSSRLAFPRATDLRSSNLPPAAISAPPILSAAIAWPSASSLIL